MNLVSARINNGEEVFLVFIEVKDEELTKEILKFMNELNV